MAPRRAPFLLGPAALVLAVGVAASVAAQDARATLTQLNSLLHGSCYKTPVLTVAANGAVVRKDGDGSRFTFNLRDIAEIRTEVFTDVEAYVVLRCKGDKPCVQKTPKEGPPSAGPLLAFNFDSSSVTDKAYKLFKDLQASAGTGKNE
jgi:hypothetical protein